MGRRKKAPSGTWVTREMIMSKAFTSLSGNAKQVLLMFLAKRDMTKRHVCSNCDSLTMTYLELENMHGEADGMARGTITYSIEQLLARGFIRLIRQGGGYQKDKSVYGLTDDWRFWVPGSVIRSRTKGRSYGYSALRKKPK
jgi:hypothetical protein